MLHNGLLKRSITYSERVSSSLPAPPPKEFLADGITPKKYPLYQRVYNHGIVFNDWTYKPAGLFHTTYYLHSSSSLSWFKASIKSLPPTIAFPTFFALVWSLGFSLITFPFVNVRPKRYTPEWMDAAKERERAENTNPVSRYLSRRRRERGPHFLLGNVLPYHQYFLWSRDSHDYHAAEEFIQRRSSDDDIQP